MSDLSGRPNQPRGPTTLAPAYTVQGSPRPCIPGGRTPGRRTSTGGIGNRDAPVVESTKDNTIQGRALYRLGMVPLELPNTAIRATGVPLASHH